MTTLFGISNGHAGPMTSAAMCLVQTWTRRRQWESCTSEFLVNSIWLAGFRALRNAWMRLASAPEMRSTCSMTISWMSMQNTQGAKGLLITCLIIMQCSVSLFFLQRRITSRLHLENLPHWHPGLSNCSCHEVYRPACVAQWLLTGAQTCACSASDKQWPFWDHTLFRRMTLANSI